MSTLVATFKVPQRKIIDAEKITIERKRGTANISLGFGAYLSISKENNMIGKNDDRSLEFVMVAINKNRAGTKLISDNTAMVNPRG